MLASAQKLQRIAFAPEVFFGFFEGEQQGGADIFSVVETVQEERSRFSAVAKLGLLPIIENRGVGAVGHAGL